MSTPEHRQDSGLVRAHAAGSRLWWYLLPLVLCPVLMLAAAFAIVPSRWFALRSGNKNLANQGYGARLVGRNCDIVIFGDSSAEIDVVPAQLQARTGLSACNIAEFAGMSLVDGTHILDRYLSQNARPKFLVFLYTPDDLNFTKSWDTTTSFEGIAYRVHNEHSFSTFWTLFTHPKQTFAFAEQGMRMSLTRARTAPYGADVTGIRDRADGKFPLPGAVQTDCKIIERELTPVDTALVKHLRETYGVGGTTVLIDATPAADCDAHLPYFRQQVAGNIDNWPYPTLPLSDFVAEGQFHTTPAGATKVTDMVADQILARMARPQAVAAVTGSTAAEAR